MQRREFLAASAAAAIGLASGEPALAQDGAAGAGDSSGRQLIELRNYHFASAGKRDAFARFLGEAMVPALNRAGVKPVGVFTFAAKDNPDPAWRNDWSATMREARSRNGPTPRSPGTSRRCSARSRRSRGCCRPRKGRAGWPN